MDRCIHITKKITPQGFGKGLRVKAICVLVKENISMSLSKGNFWGVPSFFSSFPTSRLGRDKGRNSHI